MTKRVPSRNGKQANMKVTGDFIVIDIPMQFRRRGGRKKMILPNDVDSPNGPYPEPQEVLVTALRRAHLWQHQLEAGTCKSISALARKNLVDASYIRRILRLATLAPDIVEAILDGREPDGLSLRRLTVDFPNSWHGQRSLFTFPVK